ncbi:MAG: beta-ketoacyl synthase N-terminal-like domain-containing protein, partial [Blastocatellia bacterium]
MNAHSRNGRGLEIAVIGMAGRFPGARNVDEFWSNIRAGVESISTFTDEEIAKDCGFVPRGLRDPKYTKAGGVLDEIDMFDARFFGFGPREAEITDPQHRLFLECVRDALENAGYAPGCFPGVVGLYAGANGNTYLFYNLSSNLDLVDLVGVSQVSIANGPDYLTSMISYKLDLKGPSIDIQTACSTSLVAVHLAAQSLLSGECDMAVAGGVSIVVPQKGGDMFFEGGVLSPDGHCRAFDAKAAG